MKKYPPELRYFLDKYHLEPEIGKVPIEIPDVGRNDMATLFSELDYKVGVELGVEKGRFSKVLCEANPQATIYLIDCWNAYDEYRKDLNQGQMDGFLEQTKQRLKPYSNYEIVKAWSMDAVKQFKDESLDWVYIDANHTLPYVMPDLIEWSKKVRPGGIISGHDYLMSNRLRSNMHVVYAVKCYTKAYRVFPWFVLGAKRFVNRQHRDKARSFMWVKRRWEP